MSIVPRARSVHQASASAPPNACRDLARRQGRVQPNDLPRQSAHCVGPKRGWQTGGLCRAGNRSASSSTSTSSRPRAARSGKTATGERSRSNEKPAAANDPSEGGDRRNLFSQFVGRQRRVRRSRTPAELPERQARPVPSSTDHAARIHTEMVSDRIPHLEERLVIGASGLEAVRLTACVMVGSLCLPVRCGPGPRGVDADGCSSRSGSVEAARVRGGRRVTSGSVPRLGQRHSVAWASGSRRDERARQRRRARDRH